MERIINWSLEHRFLVIGIFIVSICSGIMAMRQLPIDAFPDTTPVQVQINTVAPALSPLEIEQQVTFPVEQAISGLTGLKEVRSLSSLPPVFQDPKWGLWLQAWARYSIIS